MGHRLIAAAAEAGHPDHAARHALPDVHCGRCAAGRRRSCASATATLDGWCAAGRRRSSRPATRVIGAAAHSVRAVPAGRPRRVGRAAPRAVPVHVHLSEQRAENEACLAAHGRTPTELLAEAGLLGPHGDRGARHPPHRRRPDRCSATPAPASASARPPSATWPTASVRPARSPTPARRCASARTATPSSTCSRRPGRSSSTSGCATSTAATSTPASCSPRRPSPATPRSGWPDAGRLAPGARADLVTVRLDTVRAAGHDPADVAAGGGLRGDGRRRQRRGRRRPHGRARRRAPAGRRRAGRCDAVAAVAMSASDASAAPSCHARSERGRA